MKLLIGTQRSADDFSSSERLDPLARIRVGVEEDILAASFSIR